MAFLLSCDDPDERSRIEGKAFAVRRQHTGRQIWFRGLVEISNICRKNCNYCGIRRDNRSVSRYELDAGTVMRAVRAAYNLELGSVVLQAGERQDEAFLDFIENLLHSIHREFGDDFGITLSLGEQSPDTYRRWRKAGAHRYLLRIESSNPELYRKLHPADHDFTVRRRCLEVLRDLDYQVGTGFLIGVPGQSLEDMVGDLLFLRNLDIDMIGMGPYLPHEETPLALDLEDFDKSRQLDLGLRMIAAARLQLRDVNLAATTALEALAADGRERALLAGANVVMPNFTPPETQLDYRLYEFAARGTCSGEQAVAGLRRGIESIGCECGIGARGDAPHYLRRKGKSPAATKSFEIGS